MPMTARFEDEEAAAVAANFDLAQLPRAFYENPYPYYRALREHAPVKRMPDGAWFLTRYDDILPVYRDARAFSSDKKKEFGPKYGATPLYAHHTTSLVFNDPPLHTRVRRAILGALSQRHIAAMEPGLVALVDGLLDVMADKRDVDLIEGFAASIPIEVIGNLLGVPRGERAPLRGWSLAILGALEPVLTPERADAGNRAVSEMLDYLEGLVAARRARPGNPDTDVLTRLIAGESDGERLSEPELLHQCIFLLNAGHETTTNLIGNGLHLFLTHPDSLQRLRAQPQLITSAVEECLRFESSNQLGNRLVVERTSVRDVVLEPGTYLTLCIGAANRDPEEFADPDRFEIARQPNRHLAFAAGAHACAGMAVARLEGRVAIARAVQRFPKLRLDGQPMRGSRARFRGFTAIPARVD